VSTAVAFDPKSNANLRSENQMANIVFIQEVFGSAILYRDKLRLFLTAAQQAVVVRVLVNVCNGICRFPRTLSTVQWKY
jgi:hypothetical protein